MGKMRGTPVVTLLAAVAALILAVPTTVRSALNLTATALYMGGTDHPLSIPEDTTTFIDGYVTWAYDNYVAPSGLCTGGDPGCAQVAVRTPAQFWPVTGLDAIRFDDSVAQGVANLDACLRGLTCTVTDPPFTSTVSRPLVDTSYTVFGYSQSGTVASIEKSDLIAHPPTGTVSFVFESNPNRPNGGVLERFVGVYIPILDVTFNGATVTNSPQPTPLTTIDVVHQYDPVGDFPLNPLNPPSSFMAHRALMEPVISSEGLETVLMGLVTALARDLERQAKGATRLLLKLFRTDGSRASLPAGFSAATHDPAHILRVLKPKLETIDAGFGIDAMRLEALAVLDREQPNSLP